MSDAAPILTERVFGDCVCPTCTAVRERYDIPFPARGDVLVRTFGEGGTRGMRAVTDKAAITSHKERFVARAGLPPTSRADPVLADAGRETLRKLFWFGPQQLSDLPAGGIAELAAQAWCDRVNDWHFLTANGIGAALTRGWGRDKERMPRGV